MPALEDILNWTLDERQELARYNLQKEYIVLRGNSVCKDSETESGWCFQVG